ncbi:LADA_0A02454g1_1 [Lachancea dasiensis]|uniref:LADA_0A02454g1_1 n=1 Tax=Lachancea dasiensis TaxID=1072105 RepID=A0A1G4IMZ2_9SACH|nr:LADA_0A02454g1_1 [Lachancea dasiensis]
MSKNTLNATSLETLLEESRSSGGSGSPVSAGSQPTQQHGQKLRGKMESYPEPNVNFVSANSSSGGSSKTIGLGIARRPSDNLLMNLAQEQQQHSGTMPQPPSRKKLISSQERPLSNDSIVTQNSNIFSSSTSSTAWSSNDSSRGSSIIDDLTTENVKRVGEEVSFAETDGESTIDLTSTAASEYSASTQQNLASHIHKQPQNTQQQPSKTRYMFTNSSLARSQTSFSSSNPSPLKNNFSRHSAPNRLFSKSTSALSQQQQRPQQQSTQPAVLTPSQRYRLRREQNKTALQNSIKQKEKYYDEQETLPSSPYSQADINENFIWNIPAASNSTNSFLMSLKPPPMKKSQSKQKIGFSRSSSQNSALSSESGQYLDYSEMPPMPIAGLSSTSDFQNFQQTSENLSSVYQHSSSKFSKSKLWERTSSMEVLPLQFKSASDEGMEDLRLVSEDKVQLCSPSRPTWLPPKAEIERKSHEEKINKTMSMASLDQLERSRGREEALVRDETNRQKVVLLLDRGISRQSSLRDLKKIVWDTPLVCDIRGDVYDILLQSDARIISQFYIQPFDKISKVMESMHFPRGKHIEIEKLISKIPGARPHSRSENLMLLLKLKSISNQGLLPGDAALFHHLLIDNAESDLGKVWEMANLIQLTCFNDSTGAKFDSRVVSPRGVVASYLSKHVEFKDEFNSECLNINTWWNILQWMDHEVFMWCLDVIVVHNSQPYKNAPVVAEKLANRTWDFYKSQHVVINYKVLASLMLNVLQNYHFGFNDLRSLGDLQDQEFRIPSAVGELLDTQFDREIFFKKWRHYYKKF